MAAAQHQTGIDARAAGGTVGDRGLAVTHSTMVLSQRGFQVAPYGDPAHWATDHFVMRAEMIDDLPQCVNPAEMKLRQRFMVEGADWLGEIT